jgi:hypothetical protein
MRMQKAVHDQYMMTPESWMNSWRAALAGPKKKAAIVSLAVRTFVGPTVTKTNADSNAEDIAKYNVYNNASRKVREAASFAIAAQCIGITQFDYCAETHRFVPEVATLLPSRNDVSWSLRAKKHPSDMLRFPIAGDDLFLEIGEDKTNESRYFAVTTGYVEDLAKHAFVEEVKRFASKEAVRRAARPGSNPADNGIRVNEEGVIQPPPQSEAVEAARLAAASNDTALVEARREAIDGASLLVHALQARNKLEAFLKLETLPDTQETTNILNAVGDMARFAKQALARLDTQRAEAKRNALKAKNAEEDRIAKAKAEAAEIARIDAARAAELAAREADHAARTAAAVAAAAAERDAAAADAPALPVKRNKRAA